MQIFPDIKMISLTTKDIIAYKIAFEHFKFSAVFRRKNYFFSLFIRFYHIQMQLREDVQNGHTETYMNHCAEF